MTHSNIYFWTGAQVQVITAHDKVPLDSFNQYCVDDAYSCDAPTGRYGKFGHSGWEPQPLENFPKEFRMHLLLLGVA